MPYARVNGVDIYYEVMGEGEPIVLLNGIFMNTKSWFNQYVILSRKYRVILHDFRGQWKSGKPRDRNSYSIETHAEDLRELLDYLNIEKVHLVGTSYGGEVALKFAVKYPDYVKDLIVIAAASEIHTDLKLGALRMIEAAKTKDPYKFVLSWITDVYSDNFLDRMGWRFVERLVNIYSVGFDYDAIVFLLESFLELEKNPLTPVLNKITAPTLVIAAEKDRVKPVKYSRIIADKIRDSELVIVNNAGHAVVIENPKLVNTLIIGFIERNKIK